MAREYLIEGVVDLTDYTEAKQRYVDALVVEYNTYSLNPAFSSRATAVLAELNNVATQVNGHWVTKYVPPTPPATETFVQARVYLDSNDQPHFIPEA